MLLVNIGPIFSAILVKYCVKYWDNVGLFTLAQYLANIAGRYWAYVGYILDPHCKLQLGASSPPSSLPSPYHSLCLPYVPSSLLLACCPSPLIPLYPPSLPCMGPLNPARGFGECCELPQLGVVWGPDAKDF